MSLQMHSKVATHSSTGMRLSVKSSPWKLLSRRIGETAFTRAKSLAPPRVAAEVAEWRVGEEHGVVERGPPNISLVAGIKEEKVSQQEYCCKKLEKRTTRFIELDGSRDKIRRSTRSSALSVFLFVRFHVSQKKIFFLARCLGVQAM